jgi:hypothetical protein
MQACLARTVQGQLDAYNAGISLSLSLAGPQVYVCLSSGHHGKPSLMQADCLLSFVFFSNEGKIAVGEAIKTMRSRQ